MLRRWTDLLTWLLLHLLMGALISCSQNSAPQSSDTPEEIKESIQEKKRAELSFENYSVRCENQDQCPDHLAMVVSGLEENQWRCTGVLLDQQTMLTAQHCLPKHLMAPKKSCRGQLIAMLPETKDYPEETLECDRIISLNTMSWRPYDYALIKLKRPTAREIKIRLNFDERYHGQNITLWHLNSENSTQATLRSDQCQLNNNSLLSLYFDSFRSPLIQYSGCVTRQGSSGGPLFLAGTNNLIGLHSASIKETNPNAQRMANYTPRGRVEEIGQGTNLGCLCFQNGDLRPCTLYQTCLGQYNQDRLIANRLRTLDRVIQVHERSRTIPVLESAKRRLERDSFQWSYHLSTIETTDSFRLSLGLKPQCLRKGHQPFDLPWDRNDEIVYRDMPLCRPEFRLNDKLELTRLQAPRSGQCERIDLILRKGLGDVFEVELMYRRNGIPITPAPTREIIQVPRC
jgi:hypothetical protein